MSTDLVSPDETHFSYQKYGGHRSHLARLRKWLENVCTHMRRLAVHYSRPAPIVAVDFPDPHTWTYIQQYSGNGGV